MLALRVPPGIRSAALIVGSLLAILVIAWLSLVTQPEALATTAWWPAAGIALGLGIRFPRRYIGFLALAVVAITLPLLLWAGRTVPLAVALAVATGIEMMAGSLILRGRDDVLPTLTGPRDLGRLLVAVITAAMVFDLLSAGAAWALGDTAGAWTRLITNAPKHAAGMMLLTPLFMDLPKRARQAAPFEMLVQAAVTFAVAGLVFGVNQQMPLSFLPFVPLVWAALRLSTRLMLLEILGVAGMASVASTQDRGPFSFDRLTLEPGIVVLQTFELSMVIVFLALSLAVGRERDTAQRLHDSEELFRRIFDASVAGNLIVGQEADGWNVRRNNASAAATLPGLGAGDTRLSALLGDSASKAVSDEADTLADEHVWLTVTTDAERILQVSMVPIKSAEDGDVLALQFHDITEATHARRLEEEELERAAQVQRALLPWRIPATPGWSSGALSVPAKQVGGDFFDLRFSAPDAVLSLGDVMGKGMAAGMLAAATRIALRSNELATSPSVVLTRAANVLDGDLQRTCAFVTVAYVHVDLVSGKYRVADAGHGLHFIVRGGPVGVERISSEDMPVGLGEGWHEKRGTLYPGDAVLLVSDGLLDLWGGTVEGLSDAVFRCAREHRDCPQALIDALCAGADTSVDRDDVTAVMLRREREAVA